MEPYQERVVAEKVALDEKIAKLTAFLNNSCVKCSCAEIERLDRQLCLMGLYSNVLGERIAAF